MYAKRSHLSALPLILMLSLALVAPAPALAAPGDLDAAFGDDGIVITAFPGSHDELAAIAIDGSNRVIAAGVVAAAAFLNEPGDLALVRYLPDGSLDATFGDGGIVITRTDGRLVNCADVALDGAGRILVAGTSRRSSDTFMLARFDADGELDASFGVDGIATTGIGLEAEAYAIALDGAGRIVLGGETWRSGVTQRDFAMARYLTDGTLDTTFGTGGIVITDMGYEYDGIRAIAVDGAGHLLVTGDSGEDLPLLRYNADGALDASFGGGDGIVLTDLGGEDDGLDLSLDDGGRVVVLGRSYLHDPARSRFVLARYDVGGGLDATFGNAGLAETGFAGDDDHVRTFTCDATAGIVVAGEQVKFGPYSETLAIARHTADGALDAAFGTDGVASVPAEVREAATAVALDTAGRIVVGSTGGANLTDSDFMAARFLATGSLDRSFDGGLVTTNLNGDADAYGSGVALDAAGRVIVAGTRLGTDSLVTRFTSDGSLDPGFAGQGWWTQRGNVYYLRAASAVAMDAGQHPVFAGAWCAANVCGILVGRLTEAGEPDSTFGGNGILETGPPGAFYYYHGQGRTIKLDHSGRILVGGDWHGAPEDGAFVARFQPDGTADPAFGGDGWVVLGWSRIAAINSLALDAAGRVIAVGQSKSYGSPSDFALARLNPDGSPDRTFSDDGVHFVDLGGQDAAVAVALDGSGRIIAAGTSADDIAVARFTPDGTLDATFAGDGLLTVDLGGAERGAGIAVDSVGRIIVSGATDGDFAVLWLNPDGTPATGFGGGDGIVITDLGGDDVIAGMVLDDRGRVVVAGASARPGTPNSWLAVARYQGSPLSHHWLPTVLQ